MSLVSSSGEFPLWGRNSGMGDNYCCQGLTVGQGPVGKPGIDKDSWARGCRGHTLARSHDSRFDGAQTKTPAPGLRAGEQQDALRVGHPSTGSSYEGQRNLF